MIRARRSFLWFRYRRPIWNAILIDFSAPRDWIGSVASWRFNRALIDAYAPIWIAAINRSNPLLDLLS